MLRQLSKQEMTYDNNEVYLKKQDCREIILGNCYACKADKTCYYPKDEFGNEYMFENLSLIENNGQYIYPKSVDGKPIYKTENGTQLYEIVAGKQIFGTGHDGKQYYALDRFGNEYYPDDNTPAKLADGTPYYASAKDGKNIFPIDMHGNEYYLTRIDTSKPTTIPNRYVKSFFGDEIYPLQLTSENNEKQYLINNQYAVDKNKKQYYPKDGFKNEYYRTISSIDVVEYTRKWSITEILLDRYALTNDGKVILPKVQTRYFISPRIPLKISGKNVIGQLIRDNDQISDYITNILDPSFKPVHIKPYRYRKLITNEMELVIPKQPTATLNVVINTSLPFYQRLPFWIFIIIILIVKSFIIWWFFFNNSLKNSTIAQQ